MARKRSKGQAEEPPFAGEGAQERQRLAPVDIQQKVFRLAFRGYNERDVDEFLEEVTESLAAIHEENKRLREQLQDAGAGGSAGAMAAAQRQAEAIVQQAREHAARITSGAGREAFGASVTPAPASFLVRERAFLQRIASLVQDHARALKDEARKAREAPVASAAPPQESPSAGAQGSSVTAAAAAASMGESGAEAPGETSEPPVHVSPVSAAGSDAPPSGEDQDAGPTQEGPSQETASEPGDATAPWRPVAPEGQGDAWPSTPSDADPLVSAWESAFLSRPEGEGGPDEERSEAGAARRRGPEGDKEEPSLRELFWGEE